MFSIKSIDFSRKYFKKKILEYIVTPHFFVDIYFIPTDTTATILTENFYHKK